MYYGKNNPGIVTTIIYNNSILQEYSEEKDFEITFDTSLKFNIHINSTINKANQILGIIRTHLTIQWKSDNSMSSGEVKKTSELSDASN